MNVKNNQKFLLFLDYKLFKVSLVQTIGKKMVFNKEMCEMKISKTEASKSKTLSYFCSIYFYIFLFLFTIDITEARGNRCFPLINKTCRFGGECTSVTALFLEAGFGLEFELSDYVCHCRNLDCNIYGFNPVCGSDGV